MSEYAEELKKLYNTQIEATSNKKLERDIHNIAIAISNLADEIKALREEIADSKGRSRYEFGKA